ncbi:MAG: extracellular solute-binding protein [Candidatus Omnitrophica bacterium]|nr:extracellular solute-binding protein [Candidatus Omnitrophota bacterium]MBU1127626.1 extracellular solute-binding protein [Candidatus Omnitrophota bacterium]MBU1784954.1 extracellular solute-binding protein [Candidatus Omnitrophota bacterium]MBU1851956.1 extracellular solute-binding protein [Candidatus Omnitrophota bacterium]
MSFKRIVSILVVVGYALTCAGCGGAARKDELVMWLVSSEAQARTIMELSGEFTEKTGKKVLCQAISWNNAHSKYLTSIAGGVTPDIGTMGLTWGIEFGELGAMVDLNAAFPEDISELSKKNFPGIVESTKVGNKVYGVPLDMSEHIMFYRTDIIPTPPADWDELMTLLKKLRREGRGMILDWGSLQWIKFAPFLWQAGGDFFNSDYTSVTIDKPAAVTALTYFGQLYANGVSRTTVPLEQGMRTGDYPLAISGNWKIISLMLGAPEIKGKWAIAMLPRGLSGKRTAFIGGRVMGVFSASTMKNEAWEFIKFLSRPDIQTKLYEASLETEDSYLPPNMDTWRTLPMDEKFKKILENQAKDAKGPPPVLGWDSVTRFVNHAIQMVVFKRADPAVELKKAASEIRIELSKKRR